MRRRPLFVLSAGLLALTGALAWRAASVRDAMFDRVERRVAGTAGLTRESVALWVRDHRGGPYTAGWLRADAAAGRFDALLPLVVRRTPHSAEVGRLLAVDGDAVVAVSPAARGPMVGQFHVPNGHAVLAGLEPVPGAPWAVLRDVPVDEIAPHATAQLRTEALFLLAAVASVTLALVAARRAERGRCLRESTAGEARLAAAMRASFDAVIAVDDHERVTLCNAAAERLLHRRSDEVHGRSVGVLLAPGVRDAVLAKFRAFLASDERAAVFPACTDLVIEARDGGLRRVELSAAKGEAEGHRLCTLVIRDVTEREAAAEALRASEASARAFVENSPYGICRVAPDGRFTTVNPALARILGYDAPDDLLHVDLGQLYDDPAVRAAPQRCPPRSTAGSRACWSSTTSSPFVPRSNASSGAADGRWTW